MSGNKNNKDPIEQFFQKKMAEYDIAYREEDWLKLEKQLDVRDAQVLYQRKVRWIAAAAVIILSMLGYFTYDNYVQLNELSRMISGDASLSTVQTPDATEEPGNEIPSAAETGPARDESSATETDPGREEPSAAEEDTAVPVYGSEVRESTPSVPDLRVDGSIYEPRDPNVQRAAWMASEVSGRSLPGFGEREEWAGRLGKDDPFMAVNGLNAGMPGVSGIITTDENDRDQDVQIASAREMDSAQETLGPADMDTRIWSRLSIGLLTAPDLSTVNSFSEFYDPGYKFGLTVAYQITPRLSFSTGFIPSLVKYSSKNYDYQPYGYYDSYGAPSIMTGQCFLFDVPVSLAYKWLDLGKSNLFFSAGLSSYIMLDEEYTFRTVENNDENTTHWSDRTGTRHWFSNAGLSIGYEREITRNISLRVEPYVRIPVREVGWANVRLYSVGSFFSVHYNL